MIEYNLQNLINQYSLLGLPLVILVLGAVAGRFTFRGFGS